MSFSLQPPEPKAYCGEGIKKIHAAILENNIADLLPVIEKYAGRAMAESWEDKELESALLEYIKLATILREKSAALEEAFLTIDNFVFFHEEGGRR